MLINVMIKLRHYSEIGFKVVKIVQKSDKIGENVQNSSKLTGNFRNFHES